VEGSQGAAPFIGPEDGRGGGVVRSNDRRWSGSSMRWFLARELMGRCCGRRGRGGG
jgi:hypothetical protein